MKYRILIVEDDPVIAGAVKRQIEAWGCEARTAENFADVTADFRGFAPHLVLMDIGLPLYDGYHWCAEIRRIYRVPVIFLSSASDNKNNLMALNMGGDDFIAKPFDLNVLTAKVQALLRRTYDFAVQSEVLECGGAVLHPDEAMLAVGERKIDLTRNELRILQLLMENRGRFVRREDIMNRLWETDCYVDDNTLTVNMTRLRHKLDAAGLAGFIRTKKGVGYGVEA